MNETLATTSRPPAHRREFVSWLGSLADLVFPPLCGLCQSRVDSREKGLCASCLEGIDQARKAPACPTCAASIAAFQVTKGRCPSCRGRRLHVAGAVRAGEYSGDLGQIIRGYKYHGREELEPVLTDWLLEAAAGAPWLERVEAVTCVPTHWTHRFRRPFYPPEVLAPAVARRLRLPYVRILRRVRGGPHQIGLTATERAENIRGAFSLRRGATLHAARILVIDDVKTTGATLEECGKVLRRAGAAEVYAGVIGKVRRPELGAPSLQTI